MSKNEFYNEVEKSFASVEGALNALGYIPGCSTLSGSTRTAMGMAQTTIALLLTLKHALSASLQAPQEEPEELLAIRSMELGVHGIANQLRGSVEIIPLLNLLTIPYDCSMRFAYRVEKSSESFYLGPKTIHADKVNA